ncbi:TetR/AcrR family transcriptional regulator [Nocardia sp. NPDC004278]
MSEMVWEPRRVAAVRAELPPGVTPSGTRGRILEASLELFAEHGFAGTSIRDIGKRVGINSATLYAHYPSKENVLTELIQLGHQELYTRLAAAASAAAEPSERLAALVRAHVLAHAEYPLLTVVANAELHAVPADLIDGALKLRAACRTMLLDTLRAGIEARVFDIADPILTALAISSMGMRVGQWFGPDQPYAAEAVADEYARLALRIAGADTRDAERK